MLLHLGHSPGPANFRTHDSTPETLTPEGNKSRVSGVGVESNRPATNFPEVSVDSNRFNCLVEKSGLGIEPRPFAHLISRTLTIFNELLRQPPSIVPCSTIFFVGPSKFGGVFKT